MNGYEDTVLYLFRGISNYALAVGVVAGVFFFGSKRYWSQILVFSSNCCELIGIAGKTLVVENCVSIEKSRVESDFDTGA